MSAESRAAFRELMRDPDPDLALACLLVACEPRPDLDPARYLARLDELASCARPLVPADAEPDAAARGLARALGEQAGFAGSARDYDDLAASLLPDVLDTRHGLPILLSIVWLAVARRLGVRAYGVALPGHFVVAIGDADPPGGAQAVLVDPFRGGVRLSGHEAADLVRAAGSTFRRELLAPADPVDILQRVLTNIRVVAARQRNPRTQLWAVELTLLLPRHPLTLRRERGELLGRTGDFLGGARELEGFADAAAALEPRAAETARSTARMLRARLN